MIQVADDKLAVAEAHQGVKQDEGIPAAGNADQVFSARGMRTEGGAKTMNKITQSKVRRNRGGEVRGAEPSRPAGARFPKWRHTTWPARCRSH